MLAKCPVFLGKESTVLIRYYDGRLGGGGNWRQSCTENPVATGLIFSQFVLICPHQLFLASSNLMGLCPSLTGY